MLPTKFQYGDIEKHKFLGWFTCGFSYSKKLKYKTGSLMLLIQGRKMILDMKWEFLQDREKQRKINTKFELHRFGL